MHVPVIGGNRFVGRFLVWRLVAGGHRVTLLNRGRIADPFADKAPGDRGSFLLVSGLPAARPYSASLGSGYLA